MFGEDEIAFVFQSHGQIPAKQQIQLVDVEPEGGEHLFKVYFDHVVRFVEPDPIWVDVHLSLEFGES